MRKRNGTPKPTDTELDILNVLWDRGAATVREVHDALERARPAQYTSTLKLMQIMAEKGLVERDESARAHVYRPRIAREQVQKQVAGDLLDRLFGGSPHSLLLGALSTKRASKQELDELRRMLAAYEKEQARAKEREDGDE